MAARNGRAALAYGARRIEEHRRPPRLGAGESECRSPAVPRAKQTGAAARGDGCAAPARPPPAGTCCCAARCAL